MTDDKSWKQRTKSSEKPVSDPDAVREAIEAAQEVLGIMFQTLHLVSSQDKPALFREYFDLKGKTTSVAGFFGALDLMTPDIVGPQETEWFRSLSRFCRHGMNSLLGRKLEDMSPLKPEEFAKIENPDFLIALSKLNRVTNSINRAFPPEPAQGKTP